MSYIYNKVCLLFTSIFPVGFSTCISLSSRHTKRVSTDSANITKRCLSKSGKVNVSYYTGV
ncbi:hypothetical protein HMPREF0973_02025 [Prevotella veroralis F0319]|uniref:Uncharacterized protein n=1 Tax=Prevotella veroralis F0319 TaxID=649761 RepID=C9MQZ1_9BACT|nr:hypothetical protein HMPREF0973_02025 [Prevotella veroralis F0319]